MRLINSFSQRLFFAVIFALILAQVVSLGSQYIENYADSNGFKIANGNLVGGDFVTFYQAGAMIHEEPEKLYDFQYYILKQQEFYKQHAAKDDILVFAYPPLVGYMFGVLPRATLLEAYVCWSIISFVLFFISLILLMRSFGAGCFAILAASFAALGFYCFSLSCLGAGQTSTLGTAILSGFVVLYQRGKLFLAGLLLSLSYYKPPLFVGIVLTLCFAKNWRVLSGFLAGGTSLVLLTVLTFGFDNFANFIGAVSNYRYGPPLTGSFSLPIDKGVGVAAAIEGVKLIESWKIQVFCLLMVSVLSFYLGFFHLKKLKLPTRTNSERQHSLLLFSIIISVSLLCSLQMVAYDLTILFPFLAALTYQFLRNFSISASTVAFMLSFLALFYEYYFRSVAIGGIIFKGTTLVWGILTLSLFLIFKKHIEAQPDSEAG